MPGLKNLLDNRFITIKGIEQTRYQELAGILSRGVEQGHSMQTTATAVSRYVNSLPSDPNNPTPEELVRLGTSNPWQEMVARTETRSAVTQASLDSYRDAGLTQVEWLTADGGCEECGGYEDMGPVDIDEGFGDVDGPPAHPNCLCVILPVISDTSSVTAEDEVPVDITDAEGESVFNPATATDEEIRQQLTDAQLERYYYGTLTGQSQEEAFSNAITPAVKDIESITKLTPEEFDSHAAQIQSDAYQYKENNGRGDGNTYAMQKITGYDALPQVGGRMDIDELVGKGWTETFRGVTSHSDMTANDIYEQFKSGQFFPGMGIYGNGTYTTTDVFTASKTYANGSSAISQGEGAVWRMAISPDAKSIEYSDLEKMVTNHFKENPWTGSETPEKKYLDTALRDYGNFAMRQGYDVITVNQEGRDEVYHIVLNRGVVAVQDTTEKG